MLRATLMGLVLAMPLGIAGPVLAASLTGEDCFNDADVELLPASPANDLEPPMVSRGTLLPEPREADIADGLRAIAKHEPRAPLEAVSGPRPALVRRKLSERN